MNGKHEARFGAELTCAECHRLQEARGDLFTTLLCRTGQNENGVEAAHLGVDGDGGFTLLRAF